MKPTNIIIIDDDESCIAILELLIAQYYPDLVIQCKCHSVSCGIKEIEKYKPDLVFLDIELPDGYGFDILSACEYHDFEVIFTSSHQEYALQAFEFAALHYLLKPLTYDKLSKALSRSKSYNTFEILERKIQILKDSINNTAKSIILPTGDGLELFCIDDIIRCESEGAYTKMFFINNKPVLVSKLLHNFEILLSSHNFVRVHNKHLINLKYIKKYIKGKNSFLALTDGVEIPISESKKDEFKEKLLLYAQGI